MKKWLLLLVLGLALGLVAGCGDDDDDDDGGGGGDTAAQTQEQTQPEATDTGGGEAGGSEEVSIGDNFFEPEEVTVSAGTTIKWTNEGQVPHTVTQEGGFDSGTLEPGAEFEQTFDEAGEIDYVCTIHAGQTGKVVVE